MDDDLLGIIAALLLLAAILIIGYAWRSEIAAWWNDADRGVVLWRMS